MNLEYRQKVAGVAGCGRRKKQPDGIVSQRAKPGSSRGEGEPKKWLSGWSVRRRLVGKGAKGSVLPVLVATPLSAILPRENAAHLIVLGEYKRERPA